MRGALHDQLENLKDQLESVEKSRVTLAIQLQKCEARIQDLNGELREAGTNLAGRQSLQKELNQALKDQGLLRTKIRTQSEEYERLTRSIEATASKLVAERALAVSSKNLRISKLQIDVFFVTLVIAAGLTIIAWVMSDNIVTTLVVLAIVIAAGYLVSWAIKRKIQA